MHRRIGAITLLAAFALMVPRATWGDAAAELGKTRGDDARQERAFERYQAAERRTRQDDNDAILDYARRLVEKKQYAAAIEEYKKIGSWLRHDPGLVIECARVYTYADMHAEAIKLFEEVRTTHPEREAEILRELGDQYKWSGDFVRSVAAYQKALGNNPKDTVVREGLADARAMEKRQKEKTAPQGEVEKLGPRTIEARPFSNDDVLARARHLVEEKDYDGAIAEYKKIDEWLRHDTGLVIEFARVYTYADMHAEAIKLFEEVRTTHPEREAEILRELGDQYKWNGDIDRAIATYEKALSFNPDDEVTKRGLAEARAWREKAGNDTTLAYARTLVEEKQYEQAIAAYEKIGEWLRRDPSLIIEFARVYTYADMHAEAIALFEEVRTTHPEREAEILRELADQYKWNDNLDRAIIIYEAGLAKTPDDAELQLGLAEALTWKNRFKKALAIYDSLLKKDPRAARVWIARGDTLALMDRLEAAYRSYAEALAIEPDNVRAMNGQAKVRVWQGYHKDGARRYRAIIAKHPDDVEAMEGLAYALHWDGQETASAAMASRVIDAAPRRKASKELLRTIKQSAKPYVMSYNYYWNDKNKLSVETHGVRTGLHPDERSLVEGIYEWQLSTQKNNTTSKANRGGVGLRRRLLDDLEINSYLYDTYFSNIHLTTFTTSSWLTWWMDDMWRFDASYNRSTFTDIGSIMNKIIVDAPGISADLRPNRYWLFSGSFSRGFYSDTNIQNTVFCKMEYRIMPKPIYAKFYYNYYYSAWSKLTNNGYFNPRKIDSHSWGIYASKDITQKIFVELQGSGGYEYQTPKAYHPTYYMGGSINYRFATHWVASVKGELFRAFTDPNSNGYSRAGIMLTITYLMGAEEPGKAEFAHSASRPQTGR